MSILEIGLLGFIGLLIVLGFFKGFVKQILSVANWLLALVAAFLLVTPVAGFLQTTDLSDTVNTRISEWIVEKGPDFATIIDQNVGNEQLSDAIATLGLPKFIADLLVDKIDLSAYAANTTYAEVLAPSIGAIVLTIIAFVGIFILSLILMKIVIHFLNKLFSFGMFGIINRLLGAVLGGAKAAILVSVFLLILSLLSGVIPSVNDWVVASLRLEEEGFSIIKYLYDNNPLVWIFENAIPL